MLSTKLDSTDTEIKDIVSVPRKERLKAKAESIPAT